MQNPKVSLGGMPLLIPFQNTKLHGSAKNNDFFKLDIGWYAEDAILVHLSFPDLCNNT